LTTALRRDSRLRQTAKTPRLKSGIRWYVGLAPRPREPWFVARCQALAPEISDDVASCIDLAKLHDRYVR
jgi:hypothetical protein